MPSKNTGYILKHKKNSNESKPKSKSKQRKQEQKFNQNKQKFIGRKKKKTRKKDKGGKKSSSESCHKLDEHDCIGSWPHCKYVNGNCVDTNEPDKPHVSEYEMMVSRVSKDPKYLRLISRLKLEESRLKLEGSEYIKKLNKDIKDEISKRKEELSKEIINNWKKASKSDRKQAIDKFRSSNDQDLIKFMFYHKKYRNKDTFVLLKQLKDVSSVKYLK